MGLEQPGGGIPPALVGVPVPNCGAHPIPSFSSQVPSSWPGLHQHHSRRAGGRRAASGSPRCSLPRWPTPRSSQPPVWDGVFVGLPLQTLRSSSGSLGPFVHCLCEGLCLSQWPKRLVWERNLVATDEESLRGERGLADLLRGGPVVVDV